MERQGVEEPIEVGDTSRDEEWWGPTRTAPCVNNDSKGGKVVNNFFRGVITCTFGFQVTNSDATKYRGVPLKKGCG